MKRTLSGGIVAAIAVEIAADEVKARELLRRGLGMLDCCGIEDVASGAAGSFAKYSEKSVVEVRDWRLTAAVVE